MKNSVNHQVMWLNEFSVFLSANFSDKFVTQCGDKLDESPNSAINFVNSQSSSHLRVRLMWMFYWLFDNSINWIYVKISIVFLRFSCNIFFPRMLCCEASINKGGLGSDNQSLNPWTIDRQGLLLSCRNGPKDRVFFTEQTVLKKHPF